MILKFPGGAAPERKSKYGYERIETCPDCTAVCLKIPENAEVRCELAEGERLDRGSFVALVGGTPVYSPVSGEFSGRITLNGALNNWFIVSAWSSLVLPTPIPLSF